MIFSKFDKMKNIENEFEGEISIQPKYDVNEKLLENERIQNINNIRNISIAINVGDENLKDKKNKLSKKSKRNILILFKNKEKTNFQNNKEKLKIKIIKFNNERSTKNINFCNIYSSVIIFYRHIISYFSLIHCCKINESFIPVSIKIIKNIFIFFLSNIFNLLFLNQNYYIKKFNHFNEKYKLIHSENLDLKISTEERIRFALNNTFIYAIFTFILLIIVNSLYYSK